MNRTYVENLKTLNNKLSFWRNYLVQTIENNLIDLHDEEEIKTKLLVPIINDLLLFPYNSEYIINREANINEKRVDFSITNKTHEVCFFIEAKKYCRSYNDKSKATLFTNGNVEQIKGYFSLPRKKPYFIILTNGVDFLFFQTFPTRLHLIRDRFSAFLCWIEIST